MSSSDMLFEAISADIIRGELMPGEKLTEADLAKRFGVNRAPLREALLRLEERQLVERVPYSGTRVATFSLSAQEDLFEIREVLEGLACRKAAKVITEAELAELRKILDASASRVSELGASDARGLPAIRGFHMRIAEIAGNEELQRMLSREVWEFCRVNYQRWSRSRERLLAAVNEHEQIYEALAAHDAELAEILMRRHIAKARQGMLMDNRSID